MCTLICCRFQQKYGQYLPRHFIAGLSDRFDFPVLKDLRPPYPDIHVAEFDVGLPDIDVNDLSEADFKRAKGIIYSDLF